MKKLKSLYIGLLMGLGVMATETLQAQTPETLEKDAKEWTFSKQREAYAILRKLNNTLTEGQIKVIRARKEYPEHFKRTKETLETDRYRAIMDVFQQRKNGIDLYTGTMDTYQPDREVTGWVQTSANKDFVIYASNDKADLDGDGTEEDYRQILVDFDNKNHHVDRCVISTNKELDDITLIKKYGILPVSEVAEDGVTIFALGQSEKIITEDFSRDFPVFIGKKQNKGDILKNKKLGKYVYNGQGAKIFEIVHKNYIVQQGRFFERR